MPRSGHLDGRCKATTGADDRQPSSRHQPLPPAAVTVAELLVGVRLASGKRRDARRIYVEEILESLPIIAYDRHVAVEHAELLATVRKQGRPRGAHDLLIAATARAANRTIVTADHEAFTDLPGVATVIHR